MAWCVFMSRENCPSADPLVSDVYKPANDHNVTAVGGAPNSVGAAGGWIQGGGHSPLGGLYGMDVDSDYRR